MNLYPLRAKQETILERIAAGDETAVEECLSRYGNLVWALAKKYTSTREDAEDAVQEIFTEIWQLAARYDPAKAQEITFISTVARRRLIDRLRKIYRRPQVQSIEDLHETAPNVFENQMLNRLEAEKAAAGIKSLKPEQREMVFLNIYEGMSHGEIAARTGLPLGTVKTHIRRGLAKVREALNQAGSRDLEQRLSY